MTAEAAPEPVFYCIVCGPCLQQTVETPWGPHTMTVHQDIPHPVTLTFDEEERPQ